MHTFRRILDRLGRRNVIVFLLFLVVSTLLVNLQNDATNANASRTAVWQRTVLQDYYNGTLGNRWGDDVPPAIVQSRLLIRGVLYAVGYMTSYNLTLEQANILVGVAATCGTLWLVYQTALALGLSFEWALISALLVFAFVPWGFLFVGYCSSMPYDLPALFFSAAGITALVLRRPYWLALVIVIGTLNKETTVFLIPAFLMAQWPKAPVFPREAVLHVGRGVGLMVLYAFAYEIPRRLVQPGDSPLVLTFSDHAGAMPRWENNLAMLAGQGFTWWSENFYWIALLHVPALAGFRLLPWSLKALYFATPLFVGPIFLFGNLNEFRIFNEIVPLGALASGFVLASLLDSHRGSLRPRTDQAA